VKIALTGQKPVSFLGAPGGVIPTPLELIREANAALQEV
jgi:hypothetical protein